MRIGFPTRLARVRDFLAAPADLIAYMAEHCADTDVLTSAIVHRLTFAVEPRYGTTAAPAGALVRVCANATYLADVEQCAPTKERHAICVLVVTHSMCVTTCCMVASTIGAVNYKGSGKIFAGAS